MRLGPSRGVHEFARRGIRRVQSSNYVRDLSIVQWESMESMDAVQVKMR
jgi:hypothetical protein